MEKLSSPRQEGKWTSVWKSETHFVKSGEKKEKFPCSLDLVYWWTGLTFGDEFKAKSEIKRFFTAKVFHDIKLQWPTAV